MGLTLVFKVVLAVALFAAVHSDKGPHPGHGGGPHGGGLHGPMRLREGRDREATPRDGPRIRREPPQPQRHHYGPGPPGPPSGPRPSKSSYGPPPHSQQHGLSHSHGQSQGHPHSLSSKPRYGPPPSSSGPSHKHRSKPVYGPKGKGKVHSHGHGHSHGPSSLDSYESPSAYDRPTRQSYGPSKSGYGLPPRGGSSSSKPHRPKTSYSLGPGSEYGGPSKPSYGPPPKPTKYRKTKYRGPKPVYGPGKTSFKPSTYTGPAQQGPGSSPSSAEYSSDPNANSHLINSYGEPAQHAPSSSYAPAKSPSSPSASHSGESGTVVGTIVGSGGSVGSYEDVSSYETSGGGSSGSYQGSSYGKPHDSHASTHTEIQPSISYTLLPTYGGGATLSPDHKPNGGGGSSSSSSSGYHDTYKQHKTPYSSYRAPYDGTSFKSPVSHGGAATSYISVNHPGATAATPSDEATAFGAPSHAGQAVLTTGYRAPDSSYEGTANTYSSKPAASTYYSSIPAYTRQQQQHQQHQQHHQQQHQQQHGYHRHQQQHQYGADIQTAGSSVHSQHVSPNSASSSADNFQAPAEVFGFVPYKQVAVSASVNTQAGPALSAVSVSTPIHVPGPAQGPASSNEVASSHAGQQSPTATPNLAGLVAGGLSPQDWDAYYGDSSKQAKPVAPQQHQEQSQEQLSPNYYDPIPSQTSSSSSSSSSSGSSASPSSSDVYGSKLSKHHRHSPSSSSRKKDTTQAHLKMLLQQRAQQQKQASSRYAQVQQQVHQQQQQQHADARESYATEEDIDEDEDADNNPEDARR